MIIDDEEVLYQSEPRDGAALRVCASPRGARVELTVTRDQLIQYRQTLRALMMLNPGVPKEALDAFERLEKFLDETPAAH
jgi:hypothetical protein